MMNDEWDDCFVPLCVQGFSFFMKKGKPSRVIEMAFLFF